MGRIPTKPRRWRPRARAAWMRVRALAARSVPEFFADGCPQRAAAMSFYALLALFPLAILCVAVFGLIASEGEARRQVVSFLLDNLPLERGEGRDRLNSLLAGVTESGGAVGALGLAGLVISASGLMTAARHALNDVWDCEDVRRPPLQGKLFDIALVLGAGAVIVLSLSITIAARVAARAGEEVPGPGGVVVGTLLDLADVLPVALAFGVFLLLFAVVPAGHVRIRDAWPGALLAAVGYELAKSGFAFYLSNFGNYSAVYGSLGAVVAFMLFVFLAANVFLLGAEVASEWPGVRESPEAELRREADDGPGLGGLARRLVSRDR